MRVGTGGVSAMSSDPWSDAVTLAPWVRESSSSIAAAVQRVFADGQEKIKIIIYDPT